MRDYVVMQIQGEPGIRGGCTLVKGCREQGGGEIRHEGLFGQRQYHDAPLEIENKSIITSAKETLIRYAGQ